jgi:hypothetical protein
MDPTVITWVLVIWGVITLAPLTAVQMALLLSPHSARSKEWVIGKDEDWRDNTHFRFALGAAWADWLAPADHSSTSRTTGDSSSTGVRPPWCTWPYVSVGPTSEAERPVFWLS